METKQYDELQPSKSQCEKWLRRAYDATARIRVRGEKTELLIKKDGKDYVVAVADRTDMSGPYDLLVSIFNESGVNPVWTGKEMVFLKSRKVE